MSKLAHSNEATMRLIEERAYEEQHGHSPHKCPRCGQPNPEHLQMDGCRDPECPEN